MSSDNNTTTEEPEQPLTTLLALRLPLLQLPLPSPLTPPEETLPPISEPESSLWPLMTELTRQLEQWLVSGRIRSNNLIAFINGNTGLVTVIEGDRGGEWLFEKTGPLPASKKAIEGLEKVETEESGECAICLEEYKVGDELKEMPCKHRFHEGCIDKWLNVHGTCPLCRYTFDKNNDEEDDDDDDERELRRRGNFVSVRVFVIQSGGNDDADDADADEERELRRRGSSVSVRAFVIEGGGNDNDNDNDDDVEANANNGDGDADVDEPQQNEC